MKKPTLPPINAAPVRKPRIATVVAESLRGYIRERGLQPGDPFPSERDLAAAFAVSRIVVREALQILEIEGLVAVSHGQRTTVTGRPSDPEILPPSESTENQVTCQHHLEARSIFEASIAELVVERATEADVRRLEEIVEEMQRRLELRRPTPEEDLAFHEQLLRCTHNPEVSRIVYHQIVEHIRSELARSSAASLLESPEMVHPNEHADIVNAIRRRDVTRLRLILRYHGYPMHSPERRAAGLPRYDIPDGAKHD